MPHNIIYAKLYPTKDSDVFIWMSTSLSIKATHHKEISIKPKVMV